VKTSVIGTGYLGVTHAACMAEIGHSVIGIDINSDRIRRQNNGDPTIHETGLVEIMKRNIDIGNLSFSTEIEKIRDCDIHFICVGTPQLNSEGVTDTSQVEETFRALLKIAKNGAVIVGKSTVPVGTFAKLENIMIESSRTDIQLAWNPEFLRESSAVADTLVPSRIVIGTRNRKTDALMKEYYSPIIMESIPYISTSPETSELVKVAANSFLSTKISFINGFLLICREMGADILDLSHAVGLDPRIGESFLKPGLGYGGACLPKDILGTAFSANKLGSSELSSMLTAANDLNLRVRHLAAEVIFKKATELGLESIGALGLTFKPNTDDTRESPAVDIITKLTEMGLNVLVHDPQAPKELNINSKVLRLDSADELVARSEIVVVLTDWAEYRALEPYKTNSRRYVYDFRFVLDKIKWLNMGWEYLTLGDQS
jgi:UDPglucose 6-dehydrogenase